MCGGESEREGERNTERVLFSSPGAQKKGFEGLGTGNIALFIFVKINCKVETEHVGDLFLQGC